MTTEKADSEGRDGKTRNRPRGVLESDCAVVVPVSSTADFHQDHLNVGTVRQNEMDASEDTWMAKDELATKGNITDTSCSFLHGDCICWHADGFGEEVRLRSSTGATSVGTADLEIGVGRLQMENEDDLDENGDTALHRAIKTQTMLEEIDRLAAAAAEVGELDAANVRYQTALHLAVIVDRADVVWLLVSRGASLRRQEQLHGDTVLHLACRLGRSECLLRIHEALRWTTRNAANADRCDMKAVLHSINYEGEPCLHLAARLDDKYMFHFLLFSFEVEVNVKEGKRGQSVLHEAVNRGDMEIVNAVIGCQSLKVNQTTFDDLTALDMAINRQNGEARRVLVSAGAVCSAVTGDIQSDGDSDELTDMDCS